MWDVMFFTDEVARLKIYVVIFLTDNTTEFRTTFYLDYNLKFRKVTRHAVLYAFKKLTNQIYRHYLWIEMTHQIIW